MKKMYSNRKGFDSLILVRDDFVRDDYDKQLLNKNNIQPSIKFINETLYIMSYNNHQKESKSSHIDSFTFNDIVEKMYRYSTEVRNGDFDLEFFNWFMQKK